MKHLTQAVQTFVADLRDKMDPAKSAAALGEKMKIFDPGGPFMYAPLSERKKSERAVLHDQERAAGEALYRVRRFLADHEFDLKAAIVAARQAPGPEQAWEARSGRRGGSQEGVLLLGVLDELRRQRLDRELGQASASVVLAVYRGALADPDEQAAATVIRYVEQKHGAGWAGGVAADESEVHAALELRARITATMDSRVPAELTEAASAFEAASRFCAKVEAVGTRAVKPDVEDE